MDSGKKSLNRLVSPDHYFEIPDFQRNYSWEESPHLEDLWRDLLFSSFEKKHYFGTFLLKEKSEDIYEVIDGQQRLTSIVILLKKLSDILGKYAEEATQKIVKKIKLNYIKDVVEEKYKLKLMGEDKNFFRYYILDNNENHIEEPTTPSQRRLEDASDYFKDKLKEKEDYLSKDDFIDFSDKLFKKIKNLDLMVYLVESEPDAVLIFEVVNDRGKDLTDLEKTKSFLMHQLYLSTPEEKRNALNNNLDEIKERFGKIYNHFDKINEVLNLSEDNIQRYHYILWDEEWTSSRDSRYYQNHLPNLKSKIREKSNNETIEEIKSYSKRLKDCFWAMKKLTIYDRIENNEIKERVKRLFVLGKLGNIYPLLITSCLQYKNEVIDKTNYLEFLDVMEIFIFRIYTISQRPAYTLRSKLYRLSRDLYKREKSIYKVINALKKAINDYCDDEELENKLKQEKLYYGHFDNRANELRYLLYFYDKWLEDKKEKINLDLEKVVNNENKNYTIDHIWPIDEKNLSLSKNEKEKHNSYKYKLGNLAIMTKPWNSEKSNLHPSEKKKLYEESNIRMLNDIKEDLEDWGIEKIKNRENEIINFVKRRWPNNYPIN